VESRSGKSDGLENDSGSSPSVYSSSRKGTHKTEARLGAVDNDLAMTEDRVERDAARIACLAGVRSIVDGCNRCR
jgi:hypothetical protein